jgi:hypothetical protein
MYIFLLICPLMIALLTIAIVIGGARGQDRFDRAFYRDIDRKESDDD